MTAQSDSSLYLGQHIGFQYLKHKPPLKAHAGLFIESRASVAESIFGSAYAISVLKA